VEEWKNSRRSLCRFRFNNKTRTMAKNQNEDLPERGQRHPMVSVPDALRVVLRETARLLLHKGGSLVEAVSTTAGDGLLGRTLAEPVLMREPGYPPYPASIMDGFAVRSSDAAAVSSSAERWTHRVVDKVYAGDEDPSDRPTTPDGSEIARAVYVTTGAVVPAGCDCVVAIERCELEEAAVSAAAAGGSRFTGRRIAVPNDEIESNKWIRAPGCDIAAGEVVLSAGKALDPVDLGLLLQTGVSEVQIRRLAKVGVLSTGNELITQQTDWSDVQRGMIPDVNKPILLSLLETWRNCTPVDLGLARDDDLEGMVQKVRRGVEQCDVIITTGGISVGETDIVEQVLADELGGRLHFGRLHMKPGKPTTFVTIPRNGSTGFVFAMPGNPVSATVCTHLLVRPCLDLLVAGPDTTADTHGDSVEEQIHRMVENATAHAEVQAILGHDITLDKERPEYHRATLRRRDDGEWQAHSTGVQRSSRLASLRDADALIALPQGTMDHPVASMGDKYTCILLRDIPAADRVQVCNSKHLGANKVQKEFTIGVIQVFPSGRFACTNPLSPRVVRAMSGSKSGSCTVAWSRIYSDPLDSFQIYPPHRDHVDVVVLACPPGSFRIHLELGNLLRSKLSKVADNIALQARKGAAAQDPTAALFEIVVGFLPTAGRGSMVILLPENGLDGALSNVRGLLKHALRIARGEPHRHG
jgi:molybdenum cofactor synthesis domain-containing protein